MRNGSYETSNVNEIVRKIPAARALLRGYGIDTNSSIRLRDAAAAASMNADELLAQVEARLRRSAVRYVEQPREKAVAEAVTVRSRI